VKLEEVDVSYEPSQPNQEKTLNINDDKVKDRWSRYIGAMGIEAVAKQAESRILIAGLGPLGVEIAKNIVLAGCKELILFDEAALVKDELCGQFFISEKDFENYDYNKSKAHFSKEKL
jgi:molybdopterin/thiamine biosynthesis adenylyltransferase